MRIKTKHLIAICLAVGVLTAGLGIGYRTKTFPAKHFAYVIENTLYRSGQPSPKGWETIRDRYRIKTVADLRNTETDSDWFKTEQKFCDDNNINRIRIPLWEVGFFAEARKQFYDIVDDPKNHPVLVHCEAGSVRTGLMVASYRLERQNWTYEQAIKEARSLGFSDTKYPQYAQILKDLEKKQK